MKKLINYKNLYDNLQTIINIMEYDAQRSPGKCKVNLTQLDAAYSLLEVYKLKLPKPKTPVKKEVTNG